jgi:phosphatidylserine/phosphatidylglycerophosphate/cardiolipin synthase-like enzyme
MHDKFAVIDGEHVMTGSANYSHTALNISDEDLIVIESTDLAARYTLEFDELIADGDDKSAAYAAGDKIQVWMGPEDGMSYKVIDALDAAQDTAVVAMFQLNTNSILDAIIAAKNRGVATVVILDKVQADDPESSAKETLSSAGVHVVLAHNMGSDYAEMHSKFAVIDHKLLLMGSYNWTNLGSFFNDENLVIIDDGHMAARAEGKIADMLAYYNAPPADSLGLTTGPQAVSFEVNNVTLGGSETLMIKSIGGGPFDPAVPMTGTTLATTIEAGTRIAYRYEIHGDKGPLALEGTTHAFTVPYAPGPFTLVDTFEK